MSIRFPKSNGDPTLFSSKLDICRPEETGALIFGLDETGSIVSVFDKAVNIRISDRRLVSIVRHTHAMTPMSIHCPRKLLDSKKAFLRVGSQVRFQHGTLTMEVFQLDLRLSKQFEGHPVAVNPMEMDVSKTDLFERVLHFVGRRDGLLGITRTGESRNAFTEKGRQIFQKLTSGNRSQIAYHLAEFTGLGPGFTPSGDDLICGFLLGETLTQAECQRFPQASSYKEHLTLTQKEKAILWQAADSTSDAGRTLIWMALKGRFPRFLYLAADALTTADTAKEMLAMVTTATQCGHTSGTDALTGLLLYFKVSHRNCKRTRQWHNVLTDTHEKHIAF